MIVVGSYFAVTSEKLFWAGNSHIHIESAELNQMLSLVVAVTSESSCKPELLLFEGKNDHLHPAGLLEPLRSGEPAPKKI